MAGLEFNPGGPVDPVYLTFKAGLEKAAAESEKPWRWSVKEKKWSTYGSADWILEDLDWPDTPPGDAVKQKGFSPRTYEVQGLFVDDLFERIQEASTALTARYPKLDTVWEPLDGGSWRGAHRRAPASTTVEPDGLPKEALERIARVRKAVEMKQLTPEEGQSIITAIVLEYE